MAAIAFPGPAAAEQQPVESHRQSGRLEQWMGLEAGGHQSCQPLMQGGGAVELAVMLHAAGMPAGTLMAWPPAVL